MKRVIFLIICCTLLSGCGGLIVGAAAASVIAYKARGFDKENQDPTLALNIEKNLRTSNPALEKAGHLIIEVDHGNVLVAGEMPSDADKNQIVDTIKSVPGSKHVYDEIVVGCPTSVTTQSHDSWITTKVKSAFLATNGLDSSKIKVITENGIVYLMGETTPKQTQLATDAAKQVEGVKKIVNIIDNQE